MQEKLEIERLEREAIEAEKIRLAEIERLRVNDNEPLCVRLLLFRKKQPKYLIFTYSSSRLVLLKFFKNSSNFMLFQNM